MPRPGHGRGMIYMHHLWLVSDMFVVLLKAVGRDRQHLVSRRFN